MKETKHKVGIQLNPTLTLDDFKDIILVDKENDFLDFELNEIESNNGVYDLKVKVIGKSDGIL